MSRVSGEMGGIVGAIAGGLGRRKGEGAGGDREEHGYPRCLQIQRLSSQQANGHALEAVGKARECLQGREKRYQAHLGVWREEGTAFVRALSSGVL